MENNTENNFIFTNRNENKFQSFVILSFIFIGLFSYYLFQPEKALIAGILILGIFFPILYVQPRVVSINDDTLNVDYKFTKKKNLKKNLNDCIGYFSYTMIRGIRRNNASLLKGGGAYSGVLLKFKDNSVFDLYLPDFSKQKSNLDKLIKYLKNKNIKNLNPDNQEYFNNKLSKTYYSVDDIKEKYLGIKTEDY